jgi:hypothetical protein
MAAKAGWLKSEVATAPMMLAAAEIETVATMEKPSD